MVLHNRNSRGTAAARCCGARCCGCCAAAAVAAAVVALASHVCGTLVAALMADFYQLCRSGARSPFRMQFTLPSIRFLSTGGCLTRYAVKGLIRSRSSAPLPVRPTPSS